ncbi:prenyltransferase [Orenia marismortui]|uniref:1,4-dihydroxy-2-naphthoate prenyltransferase n=1 Tax=Orenia marismortui TaxID=46469 RepID=A0A4R8H4Z3_9FIRM|nr:prenyltransferase [Orenia marismortui]TDX52115.1 1,4-dihydroxy-2-naphthoate prenyltransferase [Orenia marismortui]
MLTNYWKAWWKALRPFSFTTALIPTILGGLLGWIEGRFSLALFLLVITSGVLLQAGTNLINDYFEFKQGLIGDKANLGISFKDRTPIEKFIFISGILSFASVIPLGLYFIYLRGLPILLLGMIGLWGGYAYTGEPFVYKKKGLGPLLVFFLMGNLMVFGSYYMQTAKLSWYPWLSSIPICLLTSLLLISNELRDIKDDAKHGIKTMSVRLGEKKSIKIFRLIFIITYISQIILVEFNLLSQLSLLTIIISPIGLRLNRLIVANRKKLVFETAYFHLYFGSILIISELLSKFII